MDILEEERVLAEAREEFGDAFDGVRNAVIIKTQDNRFLSTVKFPLIMSLTIAVIAFLISFGIIAKMYDVFYIIATVVVTIGFLATDVILALTFIRTVKNTKCTETLRYKRGKVTTIVSDVSGSGTKAEWKGGAVFFDSRENAEIIEAPGVEYNPYPVKGLRGHSRNAVLLDKDFLLKNFFTGCGIERNGNTARLSSGFSYTVEHGCLTEMSITGNYVECYENNYPLYAIFNNASKYVFRYRFTAVNDPSFVQRFPLGVREIAGLFRMDLPSDDNLVIPNEGSRMYGE